MNTSEEYIYENMKHNTVEILRGPILVVWSKFKDYSVYTKQY
jgi:hypothetical protein